MGLDYRRPPGWKLPLAIIVVVVAVLGAAFAVGLHAVRSNSDKEVAKAGAGKPRPTPNKPAGRTKPPPAKAKAKANAKPKAKPKRKRPARPKSRARPRPTAGLAGIPRWPAGRDGYTVVLLSSDSRDSAHSFATTARQGGTRVGVLRSNDYSSLEKGFWIVFTGVYPSRPTAERAATRVSRGFPGAFPQFVNGSKRR
jgi:septal ring-binding cell division protein DamX